MYPTHCTPRLPHGNQIIIQHILRNISGPHDEGAKKHSCYKDCIFHPILSITNIHIHKIVIYIRNNKFRLLIPFTHSRSDYLNGLHPFSVKATPFCSDSYTLSPLWCSPFQFTTTPSGIRVFIIYKSPLSSRYFL